jgi:putative endonuclease
MMASRKHGMLYTGVTSKLPSRVHEHREGLIEGFTKTYGVHELVWYEWNESMRAAIQREKTIKKYPREWKINLIERDNPNWDDLFSKLVGMDRQTLPSSGSMDRRDEPGDDD